MYIYIIYVRIHNIKIYRIQKNIKNIANAKVLTETDV